MGSLVLVGGGARSGKSGFALAKAASIGPRRGFVATAEARDTEMEDRIANHRRMRDSSWQTVEEPLELGGAIAALSRCDVVVVDCLTLWMANRLGGGESPPSILVKLEELLAVIARCSHPVLVVTNEVGMGIVPASPVGRAFRDLTGAAHRRLSRDAAEIYLFTLGTGLRIRPHPVEEVKWDASMT